MKKALIIVLSLSLNQLSFCQDSPKKESQNAQISTTIPKTGIGKPISSSKEDTKLDVKSEDKVNNKSEDKIDASEKVAQGNDSTTKEKETKEKETKEKDKIKTDETKPTEAPTPDTQTTEEAQSKIDMLDFPSMIGFSIKELFEIYNAPDEAFAFRNEDELDDVVFYYKSKGLYFVLFDSRVWNIRLDSTSKLEWQGVKIGITRDSIKKLAFLKDRQPLSDSAEEIVYDMAFVKSYPTRLRILFKNNKAYDIYIYRSDF